MSPVDHLHHTHSSSGSFQSLRHLGSFALGGVNPVGLGPALLYTSDNFILVP